MNFYLILAKPSNTQSASLSVVSVVLPKNLVDNSKSLINRRTFVPLI